MKLLRSLAYSASLSLFFAAFILLFNSVGAQEPDHIRGEARDRDWSIDIRDESGTFDDGNEIWQIEFFQETGGLNGFARLLSYFGRKEENFIRVDIFINSIGSDFLVFIYNYKTRELENDRFTGEYRIGNLSNNAIIMDNYVPQGKVPDYQGSDFIIESEITGLTPEGGTVDFNGIEIEVFPVKEVLVSPSWTEIWAVGLDPVQCRSYFMQFYGSPNGWLFDMSTGEVFEVAFGGSEFKPDEVEPDHVEIVREFNLEDLCVSSEE